LSSVIDKLALASRFLEGAPLFQNLSHVRDGNQTIPYSAKPYSQQGIVYLYYIQIYLL